MSDRPTAHSADQSQRVLARILTALLGAMVLLPGVLGARRILRGRFDDFGFLYDAAVGATLRQNIYHYGSGINPYPPLAAASVSLFVPLGETALAMIWLPINCALLALGAWLGAKEVVRRLAIPHTPHLVPAIALLSLLLVYQQTLSTIRQGNMDVLLLLPIVLALRWIDRRPFAAGAALAFGASFKYLTIVFVPYFLLRGRFKAALGFLVGWVARALLPALVMGWSFNLKMQWAAYAGIARMFGAPIADTEVANAAPPGLEITGSSLLQVIRRAVLALGFDRPWTFVVVAFLAAICAAVACAIYTRSSRPLLVGRFGKAETNPDRSDLVLFDWAAVTTAMLLFSPHLETRHTVLLMPVYALALGLLLWPKSDPAGPTQRLPLLIATIIAPLAYLLPSGDLTPTLMVQWRYIGGSSWIVLGFLMILLWTGLQCRAQKKAPA